LSLISAAGASGSGFCRPGPGILSAMPGTPDTRKPRERCAQRGNHDNGATP
jgi:hypothetical protein